MVYLKEKRCQQVCGNSSDNCFIGNNNQIACISDMVINKMWAVREIIRMARDESRCSQMDEFLNMASGNVDELIDWVKHLQEQNKKQIMVEVAYKWY
ncbi:MAG: hypothetical protein QMD44_01525 [Thermodesulfovibrionales bacterium]|nr:hypothetical protein [Thermodesulfovibrionales bacterium]